ncbi:hypothetical protein EUGRSUZ_E00100 [Eucalyptus grandis]|uniref:Uncharacterized protein n=2 Tax=Eucalyptus grandis TaxID=71139 RepID=A0ACC3KQ90_EUCGR|nr:hypothetical protein EUGRSUZ_E00100 [Eucalyptus grandis]
MLRLRRDQPETRHLPCAVDHLIIVGIDYADTKAGKPHVLGQAVDNVDKIGIAFGLLHYFSDAREGRGLEDCGRVYFVAHHVEAKGINRTPVRHLKSLSNLR